MRLPKIIAFNGNMGVGKSEALKFVTGELASKGTQVILVKFAAPLYDIQSYIYQRVGRPIPEPKDRMLLQFLGTDWGRKTQSDTIWVDLWETTVKELAANTAQNIVIVCDDCRFDNEAIKIKSLGGKIVKIVSHKNSERIDTTLISHESEKGLKLDYLDYIIENNGTLPEYYERLAYLLNQEGL